MEQEPSENLRPICFEDLPIIREKTNNPNWPNKPVGERGAFVNLNELHHEATRRILDCVIDLWNDPQPTDSSVMIMLLHDILGELRDARTSKGCEYRKRTEELRATLNSYFSASQLREIADEIENK